MTSQSNLQKLPCKPVIHIGTDAIRSRMGEILDCVNLRGDEFLIERKRKPLAVLIPIQKHQLINKIIRNFLTESLARENKNLSEEEVDRIANEAKHFTRHNNSQALD